MNRRLKFRGLTADTADGNRIFNGYIENISSGGLKIKLLSSQFKALPKQYLTVISGYNKKFVIIIKPCWHKKKSSDYHHEIGLKIIQPPKSWTYFIQDMLLKQNTSQLQFSIH